MLIVGSFALALAIDIAEAGGLVTENSVILYLAVANFLPFVHKKIKDKKGELL